jgi:hypothetical protein
MSDWRAASAAIILAQALHRAVQVAENSEGPLFEELPFSERDPWVLLADVVLEWVQKQAVPIMPTDDTFFRETAEMTRRHFAAIKGGKA